MSYQPSQCLCTIHTKQLWSWQEERNQGNCSLLNSDREKASGSEQGQPWKVSRTSDMSKLSLSISMVDNSTLGRLLLLWNEEELCGADGEHCATTALPETTDLNTNPCCCHLGNRGIVLWWLLRPWRRNASIWRGKALTKACVFLSLWCQWIEIFTTPLQWCMFKVCSNI